MDGIHPWVAGVRSCWYTHCRDAIVLQHSRRRHAGSRLQAIGGLPRASSKGNRAVLVPSWLTTGGNSTGTGHALG